MKSWIKGDLLYKTFSPLFWLPAVAGRASKYQNPWQLVTSDPNRRYGNRHHSSSVFEHVRNKYLPYLWLFTVYGICSLLLFCFPLFFGFLWCYLSILHDLILSLLLVHRSNFKRIFSACLEFAIYIYTKRSPSSNYTMMLHRWCRYLITILDSLLPLL